MNFRTLAWIGSFVALLLSSSLLAGPTHVANIDQPHIAGEFIVGFDDSLDSTSAMEIIRRSGFKAKHLFRYISAAVVELPERLDISRERLAITRLLTSKGVRYIEANTILRAISSPNDTKFSEQYALKNTGQSGGVSGADINVEKAWKLSKGSKSVVVAVIDTGIDQDHPDLVGNLWRNPGEVGTDANGKDKTTNGIDDDGNGYIDDFRGWDFSNDDNNPDDDNGHSHGSHCAGVIGASTNNGKGIAGINWEVGLVGIKFLGADGGGSLENAIKSVEYATTLGVNLTSNSWGGGGFSQALADAVKAAADKKILFVAAAGNDGTDNDIMPHFPSNYDFWNVISVAALDNKGELAEFSNYGAKSVDLAAPGVDILSTIKDGQYGELSGTSMAAPHVSGAVALLMSQYPALAPKKILERLLNGTQISAATVLKMTTSGRLDASAAIENDVTPPEEVGSIAINSVGRQSLNASWPEAGDDGSIGLARSYLLRYSDRPITTVAEWDKATPVNHRYLGDLTKRGTTYSAEIYGFRFNESGYFAVRAIDNAGLIGPIGDSAAFTMATVKIMASHLPEKNGEGLVLEGNWGIQDLGGATGVVFSDSPTGDYEPNANVSVTMPVTTIGSDTGLTLVLKSMTRLERGYDFGNIEIKTDDDEWKTIKEVTDTNEWSQIMLDLTPHIEQKSEYQIRFRLKSDASIQHDGWFIDDVFVIADGDTF